MPGTRTQNPRFVRAEGAYITNHTRRDVPHKLYFLMAQLECVCRKKLRLYDCGTKKKIGFSTTVNFCSNTVNFQVHFWGTLWNYRSIRGP